MAKKLIAKLNDETVQALKEMSDIEKQLKKTEKQRVKANINLLKSVEDSHEEIKKANQELEDQEKDKLEKLKLWQKQH